MIYQTSDTFDSTLRKCVAYGGGSEGSATILAYLEFETDRRLAASRYAWIY